MEVVETNTKTKKTLGRRKIEITKIQKKTSLQVTFSKRRKGLFRKAGELAVLCGAEVAILVQSPAQKMYAFGHPNVGALIDRVNLTSNPRMMMTASDDGRRKYEEAVERLEIEKRAAAEREAGGCWWEGAIEGMELHELEELLAGLEGLRENVKGRLEMEEMLRSGELFEKMVEPALLMPMPMPPTEKPVVGGDYASTSSTINVDRFLTY